MVRLLHSHPAMCPCLRRRVGIEVWRAGERGGEVAWGLTKKTMMTTTMTTTTKTEEPQEKGVVKNGSGRALRCAK